MKIYKDIISGDELCSDTFPMELVDGVVYKVKGKLRTETIDIDDALIGGNASAEGAGDEGADAGTVSGVDVVLNHKLVASPMSKKAYQSYIKGYMAKIREKLKEENPDELPVFEENVKKFVMGILKKYDDWEMFIGESYNADGMVPLMNWDGETPYVYFFKHGLEEEKV